MVRKWVGLGVLCFHDETLHVYKRASVCSREFKLNGKDPSRGDAVCSLVEREQIEGCPWLPSTTYGIPETSVPVCSNYCTVREISALLHGVTADSA